MQFQETFVQLSNYILNVYFENFFLIFNIKVVNDLKSIYRKATQFLILDTSEPDTRLCLRTF